MNKLWFERELSQVYSDASVISLRRAAFARISDAEELGVRYS
jgi:hypothetical protein